MDIDAVASTTSLHHVQVDDAAVQLGILDGAEGLDDLGFGGHAGGPQRSLGTWFGRCDRVVGQRRTGYRGASPTP
jgi:hypothetical protein